MKKRMAAAAIAVLVLAVILLGALWQQARHDRSDLARLAQAGAGEALARFEDFQHGGYESDYWGGVAAFRSFMQAYGLLAEGTSKAANYTFCGEVYGSLLCSPAQTQRHIDELIGVLQLLAEDVEDENGYLRMASLRSLLQQ